MVNGNCENNIPLGVPATQNVDIAIDFDAVQINVSVLYGGLSSDHKGYSGTPVAITPGGTFSLGVTNCRARLTVEAKGDGIQEGQHFTEIKMSPVAGPYPWREMLMDTVTVNILDNDFPSVFIDEGLGGVQVTEWNRSIPQGCSGLACGTSGSFAATAGSRYLIQLGYVQDSDLTAITWPPLPS